MRFFNGAEISIDACCDCLVGLTKPRPPSRTGRARSSRSMSDGGALPVRAGISRSLMESSSNCSREPILGIVLHKYENL